MDKSDMRYKDNAEQSVTPEQEQQADEAIKNAVTVYGVTVLQLQNSQVDAVINRLPKTDKPQNLAIFCADGNTFYYGPEDICRGLQNNKKFGGKVSGEGLNKKDGIGCWQGKASQTELLGFIINENIKKQQTKETYDKIKAGKLHVEKPKKINNLQIAKHKRDWYNG